MCLKIENNKIENTEIDKIVKKADSDSVSTAGEKARTRSLLDDIFAVAKEHSSTSSEKNVLHDEDSEEIIDSDNLREKLMAQNDSKNINKNDTEKNNKNDSEKDNKIENNSTNNSKENLENVSKIENEDINEKEMENENNKIEKKISPSKLSVRKSSYVTDKLIVEKRLKQYIRIIESRICCMVMSFKFSSSFRNYICSCT